MSCKNDKDGGSCSEECGPENCGSCAGRCCSEPKDIYEECLILWGVETQLLVTAEESCELAASINRFVVGKGKIEEVAEEVADCLIMLEQVKRALGEEAIEKVKEFKLKRLREFLDKNKEAKEEAKKEAESKAFAESLKGK